MGFVNVVSDGQTHAWIQDVMVHSDSRHQGIGSTLLEVVKGVGRDAGFMRLHVDFEERLGAFFSSMWFPTDNCGGNRLAKLWKRLT